MLNYCSFLVGAYLVYGKCPLGNCVFLYTYLDFYQTKPHMIDDAVRTKVIPRKINSSFKWEEICFKIF